MIVNNDYFGIGWNATCTTGVWSKFQYYVCDKDIAVFFITIYEIICK